MVVGLKMAQFLVSTASAVSERCAETQKRGEHLKEAGNINISLLTLGECISALRHNQQAKLLNHVPFRV